MADLYAPAGDYGYNLSFTVQDNSETAYDLTNYTVTFKAWKQGMSDDPIVDSACTVDSAADGTCHYAVQSGDFDDAGDYLIELELTQSGIVESTQYYTLSITEGA